MPDGHVFGHIRLANHLTIAFVGWIPPVADEECGRLLRGVSVIVSQNMRIGLVQHRAGHARVEVRARYALPEHLAARL
jgi:hypothetical protein